MDIRAEILNFSELLLHSGGAPWRFIAGETHLPDRENLHCHEAWELRFYLSEDRNAIESIDLIPARVWHYRIDAAAVLLTHTMLISEKKVFSRHRECTVGMLDSPYCDHLLPLLLKLYRQNQAEMSGLFAEFRLLSALICRTADIRSASYPAEKMDLFISKLESAYFDSRLSIARMAEESGYSPNYIQKLFRIRTGMTPREYLIRLRMKKAEQLLAAGGHSIKEIASLCGFSSRQYFAYAFHLYSGCAPGAYRPAQTLIKEIKP